MPSGKVGQVASVTVSRREERSTGKPVDFLDEDTIGPRIAMPGLTAPLMSAVGALSCRVAPLAVAITPPTLRKHFEHRMNERGTIACLQVNTAL